MTKYLQPSKPAGILVKYLTVQKSSKILLVNNNKKSFKILVPNYEVVQLIYKRINATYESRIASTPWNMVLKTSTKSVNLNLKDENDVLYGTKIPVYLASGQPGSISYKKIDVVRTWSCFSSYEFI